VLASLKYHDNLIASRQDKQKCLFSLSPNPSLPNSSTFLFFFFQRCSRLRVTSLFAFFAVLTLETTPSPSIGLSSDRSRAAMFSYPFPPVVPLSGVLFCADEFWPPFFSSPGGFPSGTVLVSTPITTPPPFGVFSWRSGPPSFGFSSLPFFFPQNLVILKFPAFLPFLLCGIVSQPPKTWVPVHFFFFFLLCDHLI